VTITPSTTAAGAYAVLEVKTDLLGAALGGAALVGQRRRP